MKYLTKGITKKIVSVDDQDVRSNTASTFVQDVAAAVAAGIKVGVIWKRDAYYGGGLVAVDMDSEGECPNVAAIAKPSTTGYELIYQ
jgi:hypothetical protein